MDGINVCACRFQTDRKRKEIQLRTQVNQRLEESGERERSVHNNGDLAPPNTCG